MGQYASGYDGYSLSINPELVDVKITKLNGIYDNLCAIVNDGYEGTSAVASLSFGANNTDATKSTGPVAGELGLFNAELREVVQKIADLVKNTTTYIEEQRNHLLEADTTGV